MSKFFTILLLPVFLAATPYKGDPNLLSKEFLLMERLQEATEISLANQKHLKETLLENRSLLDLYLNHPADKDLAMKVSRVAAKLLEEVKENYLLESFETDFISELTLFAQLSEKKGIPRP